MNMNGKDQIWEAGNIATLIAQKEINSVLNTELQDVISSYSIENIIELARKTMNHPSTFNTPFWALVLSAQYYELFKAFMLPKKHLVYEVGAGSEPPVLVASMAYGEGQSCYTTINLNKQLHTELLKPLCNTSCHANVIEDNALEALHYFAPSSFDVACFNHSVNDILQTSAAEARGMNTAAVDWFANEKQMIEWLDEDIASGSIENTGKMELLKIVSDAASIVRPGGHLVFYHCVFGNMKHLDWFPWDMFCDMIPMVRKWIHENVASVEEVCIPNVDQRWWMILKVR